MKRAGNLCSQIVTFENLYFAAQKAFRRKLDRTSIASFYFSLEPNLISLNEELNSWTYRPRPYRQFEIREPKLRRICSSDFRDRVVHHAICNFLEPILEKRLIFDSYACRTGGGVHRAMKRAQSFSNQHPYFLKCDIRKYFDSIDHHVLKRLLSRVIKDRDLLKLMDLVIAHQPPDALPGKGLPIGNLTSQHFANFYLGALDHFLKERKGLRGYVRYMDDFICFGEAKDDLNQLLIEIRTFLRDELKLELKEKVVRISPVTEGIPFLGFRIFKKMIRLQRPNLIRLRRKLRKKEFQFKKGLLSEKDLVNSVNSMMAHIGHADTTALRRKEFLNWSLA